MSERDHDEEQIKASASITRKRDETAATEEDIKAKFTKELDDFVSAQFKQAGGIIEIAARFSQISHLQEQRGSVVLHENTIEQD